MKKLLSIIMLLSLTGSLCAMEGEWKKEEKEQSENSTIITTVTWGFLKELPSDVVLSIISYLPLKERLHILAGLLFEIKKRSHPLFNREELMKSLLKADDKESWEMGREISHLIDTNNAISEQTTNKIIDLIQNGANINVKSINGYALLHDVIFAIGKFPEEYIPNIINALLNSGADVNLVSECGGDTPLICAASRSSRIPNYKLIQTLIQNNADPRIHPTAGYFLGKTPREIAEYWLENKLLEPEVEEDLLKTIEYLKAAEEAWEQKTASKEEL